MEHATTAAATTTAAAVGSMTGGAPAQRIPMSGLRLPVPSSAFTITDPTRVWGYQALGDAELASVGDVIVGRVVSIGEHTEIQNRNGRAHQIHVGNLGLFVLGNRYATDAFEATVGDTLGRELHLVSKAGVVARVNSANSRVQTPTVVEVLGRAIDEDYQLISTLDQPICKIRTGPKTHPRAKLILVVGTSMNAGKSTTAVAITRALTGAGHVVKASKVTGTASLKEILHMDDAGAAAVNDFTYLGYPSTYLLEETDVIGIFNTLDHAIANRPEAFWVVEIADGIEQRETAILLNSTSVTERISKIVFCAREPLSVRGGIDVLNERYQLQADLVAGLVGGAPLGRAEVQRSGIDLPVINALDASCYPTLVEILTTTTTDDDDGR